MVEGQAAIDKNKNSLTTQNITVSSLQNTDESKASGFGISGSVSGKLGDQSAAAMADKTPEQQTAAKQKGGTTQGIGMGYTSTSQSSVTSSGISQGSLTLTSGQEAPQDLDRSVTTDKDTAHALKQAWDGQKNLATVQTQVAITQEFGKLAPKAVGDYAASKMQPITDAQNYQELKKLDGLGQLGTDGKAQLQTLEQKGGLTPEKAAATLADPQAQQDYQNWKEGGAYRVATHTVIGGLTGNASGAIGAGASAAAAPSLNDLQASLQDKLIASGMNAEVASGIAKATTGAMAAGLGAATGGTAGAAAGFNQDLNNRQLHQSERDWAKANAKKYQQYLAGKTGETISQEDAYQRLLSAGYAMVDDAASKTGRSDETAKQYISQTSGQSLFTATPAERSAPFQNGNTDGSYTPEQQSRFGSGLPGKQAQAAVTNAVQYLNQPCSDCRTKFTAIDNAISALQEAKLLYQDDSGSVKLINQQIEQLKNGITKEEVIRGSAGSISDKDKGLAALVLGNPSRVVAGAGTAELLERVTLTQAIKDVRAGLPPKVAGRGNVATAVIDVPGLPGQMAASSQVDTFGYGVVGKGGQNFEYQTLPNKAGYLIPRNTDSEYKILDNIADQLGHNTSVSGTVKIVTERSACGSCLNVVEQFKAKYPNIDVKVFDNNGVLLLPPPKKPIGGG